MLSKNPGIIQQRLGSWEQNLHCKIWDFFENYVATTAGKYIIKTKGIKQKQLESSQTNCLQALRSLSTNSWPKKDKLVYKLHTKNTT
jgi:hypothetical protein